MRSILSVLGLLVLSLVFPTDTRAQLPLDNLPPSEPARRFFTDALAVTHPSLSINGFDCESGTSTCEHGLGLKQVLQRVYGTIPDSSVIDPYNRVLAAAAEPLVVKPTARSHILQNVNRLQARAFTALVTYILQAHGVTSGTLTGSSEAGALPSHEEALRRFTEAAEMPEVFIIDAAFNPDGVKWARAVTSFARAVDLYLALENAYLYYGGTEANALLGCGQKLKLLNAFRSSLILLEGLGNSPVDELAGLTPYQVQSGNWPLRLQVALGYAGLTRQTAEEGSTCGPLKEVPGSDMWHLRAVESAGVVADEGRSAHWAYQTGGGQGFWAEGPYYFHLTLEEVVPFWHALRINEMLASHPKGEVGDPFRSGWFLEPLRWMADLTTPGGRTPPLDDGNKQEMYNSSLLHWDDTYGDESAGRTYAWIQGRLPHVGDHNRFVDLVAMAIPRLPVSEGRKPPASPDPTGQHLALRRSANMQDHYLLMNGEHGGAVQRGEGHEQADQLQLLYYIDDVSYLLDSGYDRAEGVDNSTWNRYSDHNVMLSGPGEIDSNDGGVLAPVVDIFCPCMNSGRQQDVDELEYTRSGRVDILGGRVELVSADGSAIATNRRTTLYVDDPDAPYIIDLNAARSLLSSAGTGGDGGIFEMRYHGNAPEVQQVDEDGRQAVVWKGIYGSDRGGDGTLSRTDNHLVIHPFTVEYPANVGLTSDRARELYSSGNVTDHIQRLSIFSGPPVDSTAASAEAASHTTVAFIQAIPQAESPGDLVPAVRAGTTGEGEDPREDQYFVKHVDDRTIDVFVARSAAIETAPSERRPLPVTAEETGLPLTLPAEADYGFARLIREQGAWKVHGEYVVNFTSEVTTSARPDGLPGAYELHANYPNPFNPRTTVRYGVPETAEVVLDVYDVRGKRVARLIEGVHEPGQHQVVWEAGDQPSGIYFLRMRATGAGDEFRAIRKMVLLR